MTGCIPPLAGAADSAAYQAAAVAVGVVCEMSDSPAHGARTAARVALMALMMLEGPAAAAAFAYQQADELVDAT